MKDLTKTEKEVVNHAYGESLNYALDVIMDNLDLELKNSLIKLIDSKKHEELDWDLMLEELSKKFEPIEKLLSDWQSINVPEQKLVNDPKKSLF